MDETQNIAARRQPRALTPRFRFAIVPGATVRAEITLALGSIARHFGQTAPGPQATQQAENGGAAAPAAPGSVRLSKAELASANAERTNPVFSPCSGRAAKLYASFGGHVKQSAPLFRDKIVTSRMLFFDRAATAE